MSPDLRKILRKISPFQASPEDRVRVLVALAVREPDDALFQRLRDMGLAIERIIGRTVIGSILVANLQAIQADPDVAEVELSQLLERHG